MTKYLCLIQDTVDYKNNNNKFYFEIIETNNPSKIELTDNYTTRNYMAYTCDNIELLKDTINKKKYNFFTCDDKYVYGDKEQIILFMNRIYRKIQNKC